MSTDIQVFIEHEIDGEWVLIDVDPLQSAERHAERRNKIYAKGDNRPSDLSKGVMYWISADDAPKFVTWFSLQEAAILWHDGLTPLDAQTTSSVLLSKFGLWNLSERQWRIIVAIV